MSRRQIDPTEMKLTELAPFDLAALAMLGGTATRFDIMKQVEQLLRDKFAPADLRLMHQPKDGYQDFAPDGYTGDTWPVWQGKAEIALGTLKSEGLVAYSNGEYTLTKEGMQQVGSQAASWLRLE